MTKLLDDRFFFHLGLVGRVSFLATPGGGGGGTRTGESRPVTGCHLHVDDSFAYEQLGHVAPSPSTCFQPFEEGVSCRLPEFSSVYFFNYKSYSFGIPETTTRIHWFSRIEFHGAGCCYRVPLRRFFFAAALNDVIEQEGLISFSEPDCPNQTK